MPCDRKNCSRRGYTSRFLYRCIRDNISERGLSKIIAAYAFPFMPGDRVQAWDEEEQRLVFGIVNRCVCEGIRIQQVYVRLDEEDNNRRIVDFGCREPAFWTMSPDEAHENWKHCLFFR
jgi:hypothetical protein